MVEAIILFEINIYCTHIYKKSLKLKLNIKARDASILHMCMHACTHMCDIEASIYTHNSFASVYTIEVILSTKLA